MHGESGEAKLWVTPNELGGRHDLIGGDPKLDSALAGRDVRVGISRDTRVDPDANLNLPTFRVSNASQQLELFPRFDVEMAHAGLYCDPELLRCFPDSAEHDSIGAESRSEGTRELTTGDDIGAGTEVPKYAEYREVAVGLDREADAMRHWQQRLIQLPIPASNDVGIVRERGG